MEHALLNSKVISEIFKYLYKNGWSQENELCKVRSVCSAWKTEADFLIKRSIPPMYLYSEGTVEAFTKTFESSSTLLHDSFIWQLESQLDLNADYYKRFVRLFGSSTRTFDISYHVTLLRQSQRIYYKVPMESNRLERILFSNFPFLVEIQVTEIRCESIQGDLLFHSEEERGKLFSSRQLTSLKKLSLVNDSIEVETSIWKDTSRCYLSEEIIKLAPNLISIVVFLLGNRELSGVVQRIFSSISDFGTQVKVLTITADAFTFTEPRPGRVTTEDFKNMKIDQLKFVNSLMINPGEHEKRLKFIQDFTPISTTVKEFQMVSDFAYSFHQDRHAKISENKLETFLNVNTDVIAKLQNVLKIVPSFQNVQFLDLSLPFTSKLMGHILDKFGSEFPLVENLKLRGFPLLEHIETSWENLKKLTIQKIDLVYDHSSQDKLFNMSQAIQKFAPDLRELKVQVSLFQSNENMKMFFLAYPYFVWLGNDLKNVEKFSVVLNKLNWTKGYKEMHLGIGSLEELSTETGEFTTLKIKSLNFSNIIAEERCSMNEMGIEEKFFDWLRQTFPMNETLEDFIATVIRVSDQERAIIFDLDDSEDELAIENRDTPLPLTQPETPFGFLALTASNSVVPSSDSDVSVD